MNELSKNNMKQGLEALLFIIGVSLGVASAIGCFNYATLAKQAGEPDGIFWFVGLVNLVYWGFIIVRKIVLYLKKLTRKDEENL